MLASTADYSFTRGGRAVAELAHQSLGGVSEGLQPRQTKKAASAFDGVNETENIIEDLGVVGILLETHKLDVDHVETFVGLGDKFPQQVVHKKRLRRRALARPPHSVGSAVGVSMKRLILVGRRKGLPRTYCAAITTVSPSAVTVALIPQALARRPA